MTEKSHDDRTRQAYLEIMAETKRAARNSETMGTSAWKKRSVRPNKRFLQSTLIGTLKSNHRESSSKSTSERRDSRSGGAKHSFKRKSSAEEESCSSGEYRRQSPTSGHKRSREKMSAEVDTSNHKALKKSNSSKS